MSRKYPVGSVVCIPSNQDLPMTVIRTCETYTFSEVVWIDENGNKHKEELHDNSIEAYKGE